MTTASGRQVLGYIRVSTGRQVERGRSLPDQRRRLKDYVKGKLDVVLTDDDIYSDPGMSGTLSIRQLDFGHGQIREQLSDLVERCMTEDVEALVIDTIDRLGRDPFICLGIQRMLEPHGTRVLVADGDLDFSNPHDETVLMVTMTMDRAEWRKMSHRATRNQAERRDAGYPPWGKLGFGWRWQTDDEFRRSGEPQKGIVRVEEEAGWVRWIFEQYAGRGRVLEDICAELNERQVPYRDSQVAWQPCRLRRMLDDQHSAGLIVDNEDEIVVGAHFDQRIIDPDVWHAAQRVRAERSTRGPRALSQRDAPLLGVARCGMCGRNVQLGRDQRDQPLYVCPRPQEGEDRACTGFTKRADAVDAAVADMIRQIADAPRFRKMIREEAEAQLARGEEELQQRRDELAARIEELDDRLEQWAVKLTDGVVGAEAFGRVSGRWQQQRQEAHEQLQEAQRTLQHGAAEAERVEQVMRALDSFADTWERLGAPAIRQLLLSMVESLTIEPGENSAVTVRLKCFYMPQMVREVPHLRGALGGDDPRLADLTVTDLAFLALWAEGKSILEIDRARGLKPTSSYSRAHHIRQRSGLEDLDEIARAAAPLIEQYRPVLPLDRTCADVDRPLDTEPTERQIQVAGLYAEGLACAPIARRLDVTPTTVRRHMCNLRERLQVHSNDEAITALIGRGLL